MTNDSLCEAARPFLPSFWHIGKASLFDFEEKQFRLYYSNPEWVFIMNENAKVFERQNRQNLSFRYQLAGYSLFIVPAVL